MKACFYIGPVWNEWWRDYFPNKTIGELPIAGKSWCLHALDLCSLLSVTDVYLAECYYREDLPERFWSGDFWSLRISCLPSIPCAVPEQLLDQHAGKIPADDDLLFFWGQVLPDVKDVKEILSDLRKVEEVPRVLPEGIWLLRGGELYECVCPLFKIDSLKHYFELNFHFLDHPGIYNLPGYSTENGCSIGMDVVIMPGCELERPVIIRDSVCLERGVRLHGGVILGKEVLVDGDSELEHVIVLNHTYIGKSMFFRNKIVDGNRVIDVENEACVELTDAFLSGSTQRKITDSCRVTEWLLALFIAVICAVPYLLTLLLYPILTRLAFFEFLFRIYPNCWKVLFGKASLVRFGHDDDVYVFRFSDMHLLHEDEHTKDMDDIYFYYHRTPGAIFRVAVLSLLKRFLILKPLNKRRVPAEKKV